MKRICDGFGEKHGTCTNVAGTPWTPYWCHECDQKRRDHITARFEEIAKKMESGS